MAERIERDGLSVRDVERIESEQVGGEDGESPDILPGPGKQQRTPSDQLASLEQDFRHALGLKVEIKASPRGRGKIVIHFQNHDEFDRLRKQITGALGGANQQRAA